jgi:mannose-6-phosphate isomerase-like protein (cupin superfamily)/DNA-binding transcriptional regulator YiaG
MDRRQAREPRPPPIQETAMQSIDDGIGGKIREAREAEGLDAAAVAKELGIPPETYRAWESGQAVIPANQRERVARRLGIDPATLLTGHSPVLSVFDVTRAHEVAWERSGHASVCLLAKNFKGARFGPYLVQVPVVPEGAPVETFVHADGQEFSYVLEGRLLISVNGRETVLAPGDSILFDATKPHYPKALDGVPAKYVCIITRSDCHGPS